MNLRNYNIYFHTHTISGIIITAVLYVIFFAGSFSFFKQEISNWQKNTPVTKSGVNYNQIFDTVGNKYNLYGREVSIYMPAHSSKIGVSVSASKDTVNNKEPGSFFYLYPETFKQGDYKSSYDLGEFLYRLHFLAQIKYPVGYYLAGGVAFIFLFALLTGLLVHWQKIVSNFYIFRPWEKLKTVWTDLHTALGVISFPYMFVFAVTGAYFLISYPLFTQPVTATHFDGNRDSLYKVLGYGGHDFELQHKPLEKTIYLNEYVGKAKEQWGDEVNINHVEAINYGDESMQVHVGGLMDIRKKFTSNGELVFDARGNILKHVDPRAPSSYADVAQNLIYILHFGNYGGYALKILYFLLGISGCVVIISGVLIWLVARDKKNIPEKKRKFNFWLTNIYLGICLSMFPVTAAAFIAVKLNPDGGMGYIYKFYFYSWLVASILLIARRNLYKTNRDCMLAGSLIGICIPVVNGVVTNNWIWNTYKNGYHDILLVDVFWILVSVSTFVCWRLIVKKNKKNEKTATAVPAASSTSIPDIAASV